MMAPMKKPDSIFSFAPVTGPNPRVLILGSMPGVRSLVEGRYYAHPRNSFWPIMGRIVGFDPDAAYAVRLDALRQAGIALWDVLHSCVRPGSLDSAIADGTRVANDFSAFFARYAGIRRICFNGGEAQLSFRRFVAPALALGSVDCVRMPSTSPAHAALSFERKLAAWRTGIRHRQW